MSENKGQLLRDALERFDKMRIDEATLEKACSQCVTWQRTRMLGQKEHELKQRVQELERNNNMLTNLLVELISHKIDIIKHPEEESE